MLKIAIPNKGSLSEESVKLLKEAGYKCKRRGRELIVVDKENEIEFIYLRPRDIAVYVANGVLDLGITGRDLAIDSNSKVEELLALNFGNSRFFYAVPAEKNLTPDDFEGMRIASSYPNIVKQDMEKRGLKTTIVRLDGAVEISIKLGVADAIADVVSSGATLKEAGLKIIGSPIIDSEAILISRDKNISANKDIQKLVNRLQGILVARSYAMIEYDVPRTKVEAACLLTPGIESPTISPLAEDSWVAVKSMVKRKEVNEIMDKLKECGAKGIIITDIRTCRL